MTLVEFFDNNSIDNILSSLILKPGRIILLGSCQEELEIFSRRMLKIFENRELNIKIDCFETEDADFNEIKKFLYELVEKYGECAFDLTGGSELIHVAVGAVSEKLPLSMHFVDSETGKLSVCLDSLDIYSKVLEPKLGFEEIISLFGGAVKQKTDAHSYKTENFIGDIKSVWEICRKNCSEWNKTVSTVSNIIKCHSKHRGNNSYVAMKEDVLKSYEQSGKRFSVNKNIFLKLAEKKLFLFSEKNGVFSISFKNKLIKDIMTSPGKILELYTYMMAETLVINGEKIFDEAFASVVIEWTNKKYEKSGSSEHGAGNEIDVVLQKGITPFFISCKNGACDSDELYKLAIVAEKFGGRAARKILLTTYYIPDESFMQRANELGITVICGVDGMSYRKFSDRLFALDRD